MIRPPKKHQFGENTGKELTTPKIVFFSLFTPVLILLNIPFYTHILPSNS